MRIATIRPRLSVALAVCLALGAAGTAAAADFAGLRAWAGKYPFDKIGGRELFDYPGLRAAMRRALGANNYAAVARIKGPEVPVIEAGGVVYAHRCQAHDCGDKHFAVAVRIATGEVMVCWHNAPARPDAFWYKAGQPPKRDPGHSCPGDAAEIAAALRRVGF